jgi:predicted amidohydrolase YtcJ
VSTGDDHLISGGVKIFADGSGGARTAWLHEDWNKNHREVDAGNRGYSAIDAELLRKQIQLYHDAGLHMSVHAIGDRAIDWVVDSYALALQRNPAPGRRYGIIHANIPSDHAIETMAQLQRTYDAGFPEPSATFTWWIGDTYAGNFGPERCLRLNPFKTYLENGIRWADGSDFDVTPFPARSIPSGAGRPSTSAARCAPARSGPPARCSWRTRSARSRWASTPTSRSGTRTPTAPPSTPSKSSRAS